MVEEQYVQIHIPPDDILSCVANFGKSLPLLSISTSTEHGDRIRQELNMTTSDAFYNPESNDETERRITFVAVSLEYEGEVIKNLCDQWAQSRNGEQFFMEIDQKAANEMLVLSTPPQLLSRFTKIPKYTRKSAVLEAQKFGTLPGSSK
jgi:hypothetical protein